MQVWECALGFMNTQILLTAEEIGVFKVLSDGGATLEDVAQATDLPDTSAQRLLTALCALEIVEKRPDGGFVNSQDAEQKLVRGSSRYIGGMFRHLSEDLYPLWRHLKGALLEERSQWHHLSNGDGAANEEIYDDPQALRDFHEGMFAISHEPARELGSGMPELEQAEHVVDIGGSSGAFLIALTEIYPQLRGTVFDLPQIQPIAEDYFERYGRSDRLRFQAGDFWNDPIPEGADVYSLGFVLHDWDTSAGSKLLAKTAGAMRPGGTLVIGEYLLDDDRTGPLHVARQDLNMLVAARGRERTAAEYADWIRRFGFELDRVERTSHGKHFLIATYESPTNGRATDSTSRTEHAGVSTRSARRKSESVG